MRTAVVTILLIVFASSSQAQRMSVGIEAHTGSYSMALLKKHQALPQDYYIPFESVQNFPNYPGFRFYALAKVHNHMATGILLGFNSTGSRMAYSDYTGSAYRDVTATGAYIGSYNRIVLVTRGTWSAHVRFNVGMIRNAVSLENVVSVYTPAYQESQQSDWRSTNLFVEVGAEGGIALGRFFVKVFSGYEINYAGQPKLIHQNDGAHDDDFKVEWDGFRVGIGVDVKLSKKK